MKRGKEKNLFTSASLPDKGLCLCNAMRQGFLQTGKIEVVFTGAVLLPEHVIEFGGKGQFAQKVAEGVFVEHLFTAETQRARSFSLCSRRLCDSI
jgi:hypothetical protein